MTQLNKTIILKVSEEEKQNIDTFAKSIKANRSQAIRLLINTGIDLYCGDLISKIKKGVK